MEDIVKWFADPARTFESGRDLYLKYGRNKNIKDLLTKERRGQEFLIRKLEYELKKLLPAAALPETPIQQVETNPVQLPTNGDRFPSQEEEKETPSGLSFNSRELPKELQEKYSCIKEYYILMSTFHEKMKQAKTDKTRDKWRGEVLQVEDLIIAAWKDIDAYLLCKEDPAPDSKVPPVNIVERISELTKRQETVNDSIARARRELKKGGLTEKKIENRKASIKKYETELKDIEKELGELNGDTR